VLWMRWQLLRVTRSIGPRRAQSPGFPCPRFAGAAGVEIVLVWEVHLYADADDLFACLCEECAFLSLEEATRWPWTHLWEYFRWICGEVCHEIVACERWGVLAGRDITVVCEIDVCGGSA
jgi:hypothetical protein